jgi:hypothetical protein
MMCLLEVGRYMENTKIEEYKMGEIFPIAFESTRTKTKSRVVSTSL